MRGITTLFFVREGGIRLRSLKWGLLAMGLVALCGPSEAPASDKWGMGGFVDVNIPFRSLRDRFSSAAKYGATFSFVRSSSFTAEIEYHRSNFDKGKLATMPFKWPVDKKTYTSPNARSTMMFNSVALNALLFPGEKNQSSGFRAKGYRYYILLGGGIYRYKAVNENLVYPAQTKQPIDLTNVMLPQVDQRYTLAADFGFGLEGFVTDNLSVDVRGRYNLVVGELRPMLFYNLETTWPIMLFDVGVGLKIYFWK